MIFDIITDIGLMKELPYSFTALSGMKPPARERRFMARVERLRQHGYVRVSVDADTRRVTVTLTPVGLASVRRGYL